MLRRWRDPVPLFFSLTLTIILILSFAIPPWQVADEPIHFIRAYQFSELKLHPEHCPDGKLGLVVPKTVKSSMEDLYFPIVHQPESRLDLNTLQKNLRLNLNDQGPTFYRYHNPNLYSPTAYVPQIVSLWVLKPFEPSPIFLLWGCRLLNAFVCCFFLFAAIKKGQASGLGWYFLWMSSLPMSVIALGSASADGLTIALSLFFLADLWSCRNALKKKDLLRLTFTSVFLACGKLGYLFFPAFGFFIFRHQGWKKALAWTSLIWGTTLICCLLWGMTVSSDYFPARHFDKVEINPDLQMAYVIENPSHFFGASWQGFQRDGSTYCQSFLGMIGWMETPIPTSASLSIVILFILCVLVGQTTPPNRWQRLAALSVMGLTVFYLVLASYLTWTPLYSQTLEGIQGRYFIPLCPLLGFLFGKPTYILSEKHVAWIFGIGLLVIYIFLLRCILYRYWWT